MKIIKENNEWILKEGSIAQLVKNNIDEIVDVFILFLKRDNGFSQKEAIEEVEKIKKEIGLVKFFSAQNSNDYVKMSRVGLGKILKRTDRNKIWMSGQNAVNNATAVEG